jgi:hypothetical protein
LRKLNPSEPVVSANAAPSARKARTKTSDKAPVSRAAKHSKAVVEEPVAAPSVAAPVVNEPVVAVPVVAEPIVAEHVAAELVVPAPVAAQPVAAEPLAAAPAKTVSREDIAKLAYCYWADRGYQGGSPEEDWLRAENTLSSAAVA